ncbi:MAG: TrmB family transcriptional regulator [Myxococcales bacterium]|nr:TrmB family transcriptional regulator [Myxococcales bacterium]
MGDANDPRRALEALGFTPLEAEVYVLLVERPASTGYRIAQALGKAAAGIYKALDSLSRKGAVVVNEDDTKSWRAVPPDEMIAQLERQQRQQRAEAQAALASLATPASDERIYRLTTFDQVMGRVRRLLGDAEEVAVVDLFPACLERLRDDLAATKARGVDVLVKLYAPATLDATYHVVTPDAERLLSAWQADWLNLVIDGREHVLALLDCEREHVYQAVWSSSAYLSALYHSGITSEIRADALGAAIGSGSSTEELVALRAELARVFSHRPPAGMRTLMAQLGPRTNP